MCKDLTLPRYFTLGGKQWIFDKEIRAQEFTAMFIISTRVYVVSEKKAKNKTLYSEMNISQGHVK